jgi:hypothetical protein
VVVVTKAGRERAADDLATLTAPFEGLETSVAAVAAGATVTSGIGPAMPHASLPLLLSLDRWAAQAAGAVTGWQPTTSAWFTQAWEAAQDTGRYAWAPHRSRRAP